MKIIGKYGEPHRFKIRNKIHKLDALSYDRALDELIKKGLVARGQHVKYRLAETRMAHKTAVSARREG